MGIRTSTLGDALVAIPPKEPSNEDDKSLKACSLMPVHHQGSMASARGMRGHLSALASNIDEKICFLRGALTEYRDIRNVIDEVTEEKERLQKEKVRLQKEKERLQQEKEKLQQDKEVFQFQKNVNGDALVAMKEDLLASKNTLAAARDALMASTEEISRKNNEVEVLKKKLQESAAKNHQAEQHCGSHTEIIQPRGVWTRSTEKRKRPSEEPLGYGDYENEYTSQLDDRTPSRLESMGNVNVQTRSVETPTRPSERPLGNGVDNLELMEESPQQELAVNNPTVVQTSGVLVGKDDELEGVRNELIKGFLKIDYGGRKLGIKEMGELNAKAFNSACLAKVPPEEVGATFYKLYTSWQQQLGDLSWYPFKAVTVDGNCQEIVDVDDDKLQELKRAWGEGAYNAVVNALIEMKEYDRLSDRSIAYELWNYQEGRKATTRECVEYMCNQVKNLSVSKRRKTRRMAGLQ